MRIKEIMNKSYCYLDETPNFEIRQSIWRIQMLSLGRRKRVNRDKPLIPWRNAFSE